jgi:hypothetical protein
MEYPKETEANEKNYDCYRGGLPAMLPPQVLHEFLVRLRFQIGKSVFYVH